MSHIRLEQALRKAPHSPENDSLYAAAFDNAPHAMALLASDGSILHANRFFCDMLGYTRHELRLRTLSCVTHPDDIDTEVEQRNRLGSAEIARYELVQRCMRADGAALWVRLSVAAMRVSPGDLPNFIAQLESVPPYNLFESGNPNEAETTRFRDATLSVMHEIGNTLTPLMLNTQMLVEQSGSSGSEISESAHEIFKAARRIAFTLRRIWGIQEVHPVAYLGQSRMLDLRLLPPRPSLRSDDSPPADVA